MNVGDKAAKQQPADLAVRREVILVLVETRPRHLSDPAEKLATAILE